jgi:uncharacterized protein (DUF342 family)
LANEGAKLSFNATLCRVRVDFTKAHCMASPTPTAGLVERARAKMDAIKASGEISYFVLYEERLKKVWEAARASQHPDTKAFSVTLAAGTPNLPGLSVTRSTDPRAVALLNIEAPAKVAATWRFEWVKLIISRELRALGIQQVVNPSQIHGALLRAGTGQKILKMPLSPMPASAATAEERKTKPYTLMASKGRLEVAVLIHDPNSITSATLLAVMTSIAGATNQIGGPGIQFKLLKEQLTAAVKRAQEGPEAVGLDLPMVILVALGGKSAGAAPAVRTNYPGAGKIRITPSADKMEARISAFDMKAYEDASFEITPEWLDLEIKRNLITFSHQKDILKEVLEALGRREDITGKVVAVGDPGAGGAQPYLHISFKEVNLSEADLATKTIDIREMQQRALVQRGQLVAEVRYATAARRGRNVLGEQLDPPRSEELHMVIGDGIQRKGDKFFATFPGVPVIEGENISLNKALIHEGDVNLKTGNIRFEGPAEIHGNVDTGAIVDVTGDLKIAGGVRGGIVLCGGELTVEGGIVTGTTGKVQARGDTRCEFIENSKVVCGGSLEVAKAIMTSQIISGGHIEVTGPTGVIAGGTLACREYLKAQNVGLTRGAITELNVGVDPRAEISVQIRQSRLDRVNAKMTEDRQAVRELARKTGAQLTSRHAEMKAKLTERLGRARILLEKMQAHLAQAKSMLNYNSEAKIYVNGLLSNNIRATVGGNTIAVPHEVAGVAVCAKRKNGSHIVSIEDAEAKDKKDGASTSKKAS